MKINVLKLDEELKAHGISFSGCNSAGKVWDVDGVTEIQDRPDVAAVIAAHDAAAYDAAQARIKARRDAAQAEAKLATALKTVTPAQAETYIQNNVTDLASAKAAMKLMARMLIALRDQVMAEVTE